MSWFRNSPPPPISRADGLACADPRLVYLWIGSYLTATNTDELEARRITHIYSFLEEPAAPKDILSACEEQSITHRYFRLDDEDSEDVLTVCQKAYRKLDRDRRKSNARILIHCRAGISRSASFVLYHLMRSWKLSFEAAYRMLKFARPCIDPNHGFRRQL
jgi:protein tyrosine phosphatase